MEGYDDTTYGERFAEVYDDWYGSITDTLACVDAIVALSGGRHGGGNILELGVGTGRLAIPLTELGMRVTGVDASPAMLERLRTKPGGERVTAVLGDMTDPPVPTQAFTVAFVAYNTLFNLVGPGQQQRCLTNCASRLEPGGALVVEAYVPSPGGAAADVVTTRRVTANQVVLSVSRSDPDRQEVQGQYVDITEAGIKLRPWHIRWSTPEQLDAMAADARLRLEDRWADWAGTPFTDASASHVSVYRAP